MLLQSILLANRADLLDGFPARAVITALSSKTDSFVKLNELLAPYHIYVNKACSVTHKIDNHSINYGILSTDILPNGDIIIAILPCFFDSVNNCNTNCSNETKQLHTIVVKALMFQSACLHQLVHRHHKHFDCKAFIKAFDELSSDEHEMEAKAARIAHDMIVKDVLLQTGDETLQDISPKIADWLSQSRDMAEGSFVTIHKMIKGFL